MQKLVRDVHAVLQELGVVGDAAAAGMVDIVHPRPEDATAEHDVRAARHLLKPLTDCLVRETDILRHLPFNGDLHTGLKHHDIRH